MGVRKESPLILGVGDGEYFLASDAPAILQHTRELSTWQIMKPHYGQMV
jgi:glucosamine--fructose-6-phosphate aminotransferase (isomerizing)